MEDPNSPTPMTPEIQKLILEFVGHTYGETKKLGENIVQRSMSLTDNTADIQQSAGKILKDLNQMVKQQQLPVAAPQFVPSPQPVAFIPPVVAPAAYQQLQVTPVSKIDDQLEFDFPTINAEDVFEELRSIKRDVRDLHKIIGELKSILESNKKKLL